jgi:hypothetical protein
MQFSLAPLVLAVVCGQTPQTNYRTTNFVIQADSIEVAQLIGEAAESCRKDLGKIWLEKEPADWQSPCRLRVTLNMGRVAGVTDVSFSRGKVRSQKVEIEGPLDRVLKGPLPHELTHVLFAHHFGKRLPCWADEGGAILSEDEHQGARQCKAFRQILAEEKCFPLRRFLEMKDYPADMQCLYAQGHSVSQFLVESKGRKVFLAFIRDGMENGWDEAAKAHYACKNVERLELAWLGWVEKQSTASRNTSPDVKTGAAAKAAFDFRLGLLSISQGGF